MTKRGFIYAEEPQQCDDCGAIAELRPYGPGGSCICHPCSSKYPAEQIEARMAWLMFGAPEPDDGSLRKDGDAGHQETES